MKNYSKLRNLLLTSVPVLAVFAALAAAVWGRAQARRAKELEAVADEYAAIAQSACSRCSEELSSAVSDIVLSLEKLRVTASPALTVTALEDAALSSRAAASILSRLPLACARCETDAAFLTRVGEYARSLSRRVLLGEELPQKERDQLETLLAAAAEMGGALEKELEAGGISALGEFDFYADAEEPAARPAIDYDGVYSESAAALEPACLSLPQATEQEALEKARALLGPDALSAGLTGGRIPSYGFSAGEKELELTANGLRVLHLYLPEAGADSAGTAGEGELAVKAAAFLASMGYENMELTALQINGGEARLTFCPRENGVLILADKVLVTSLASTGAPYGLDAAEYLMHGKARDIPPVSLPREAAEAALRPGLAVTAHTLALVPLTPGTEVLCHAFDCEACGGAYRVYVDAETGREALVVKLVRGENGFGSL